MTVYLIENIYGRQLEHRHRRGCVSHPGCCQKPENKVSNFSKQHYLSYKTQRKAKGGRRGHWRLGPQFHSSYHLISTHFPLFLPFRVRVERVTSAVALSQHLQHQVLSRQDRGAIELETLTPQGQTGTVIFSCRAGGLKTQLSIFHISIWTVAHFYFIIWPKYTTRLR